MPNWTESMQQTFEYYMVDPGTWKDYKKLDNVTSCTISRDSSAETKGSATIDITESVGECYIRVYLVTIQNGITEKHPLGTFLVQTPSSSFNGKIRNVSMDAYTPLLELKENQPPIGYYVPKETNIMDTVYTLSREHLRAPVVKTKSDTKLKYDFVADPNDTWLSFLSDLLTNNLEYTDSNGQLEYVNAKYSFDLDEMGRVLFSPEEDAASLRPVWTYDDGNSSILYPELSMEHDLYGIPNVVEVVYSNGKDNFYHREVNNDPNSPISVPRRGREIVYRVIDPDMGGNPTDTQVKEYAKQLLRDLSSIEYTLTYTHGYCPVRVGDCVRLNYARAGLTDIKAKVISQSIKCETGCSVTEKAVFTMKLWG